MNETTVVTGRIIEVNADRVLTQQGDMFCTYHPRYYALPDAEIWTHAECDPEEKPEPDLAKLDGMQLPKRRWNPMWLWFLPHKKSANRI